MKMLDVWRAGEGNRSEGQNKTMERKELERKKFVWTGRENEWKSRERKLVEVKWRQSCARKVGKGVKGVPKAGNEKIPRYQWEVDIKISIQSWSRYQWEVDIRNPDSRYWKESIRILMKRWAQCSIPRYQCKVDIKISKRDWYWSEDIRILKRGWYQDIDEKLISGILNKDSLFMVLVRGYQWRGVPNAGNVKIPSW